MTTTFTITDDIFFANESSGRKTVHGLLSCTNPYSAGGEVFNWQTGTLNFFKSKFYGARVVYINPSVPVGLAGLGATGTFRGDNSSIASALFQLFNSGLSATATAGQWVDNTVSNISGLSIGIQAYGV